MKSFLQTSEWQQFQEALGRTTYLKSDDGWSYLAIKESGTGNTRLYTPYGPDAISPKTFTAAIRSLIQTAKRENATFIRIEPAFKIDTDMLRSLGFLPVTYQQLQPAHTQIISLAPTEADILAGMSQNSRNITRNYHKKGITIRTSRNPEDITILTSLLARVAARNHITPHSETYFKTQADTLMPLGAATLYIAELDKTPIAAALVYDNKDTRIYAHAAADDTYRKLSAGTAIVGQLILDAKKAGLSYVDLYGIADTDDPSHPWAGFTKFKKSFGGQSIAYSGAWDLPLIKHKYWLYRLYQLLRKKIR